MADEKSTNQTRENEPEQGKAMGAAANTAAQGQQVSESKLSEIAGQGGGIQGSGQRQPNPGGYTEGGDRDEGRGNQSSTERKPDPTQGE